MRVARVLGSALVTLALLAGVGVVSGQDAPVAIEENAAPPVEEAAPPQTGETLPPDEGAVIAPQDAAVPLPENGALSPENGGATAGEETGADAAGAPDAGALDDTTPPLVEPEEPVPEGVGEPQLALPMVVDARVSTTPQRARLVLDLVTPTQFAVASIDGPDRIVVDVKASGIAFTPVVTPAGTGIVYGYLMEQPEPGRVRATLLLRGPAQVQQAYLLEPFSDQPARLVVDLVPAAPEEFARHVAEDLRAAAAQQALAGDTSTTPGGSNIVIASRPLVVIDPGHGGVDNGASAPSGVREKDIVLAFALKLQDLLVEAGRFDVALTREDDSFLRLEDRVALARENKADLFISIHADSFQQPDIRGASVYTRDEAATDALDKVLADSENKRDVVAGFVMPEMDDKVVDILVDLMRRETRKQSYIAAQDLVHQLEPSVALRRFPVRQADFLVLQAPDVPSVLVELGFLSNAEDIVNLTGNEWRDRTAEALARGISSYFDGLETGQQAVVAQQGQ